MADSIVIYMYIGVGMDQYNVSLAHKLIDYIKSSVAKNRVTVDEDFRAVEPPADANVHWDEMLQQYVDNDEYPNGGLYGGLR